MNLFNIDHIKIKGMSLLEVTISIGVMSIMALIMANMTLNQSRELKSLEQKIAIGDLKIVLDRQLSNPAFCKCLLNGKTFNETTKVINGGFPSTIPNSFTSGCVATGGSALNVGATFGSVTAIVSAATITSANEVIVGSGSYIARLNISFDQTMRPFKPIEIPFNFFLGPGPVNARPISTCSGQGSPTLTSCYATGFQCAPACQPNEVVSRVELCSFAYNPGCDPEGCGGHGNDWDLQPYQLTCCKITN